MQRLNVVVDKASCDRIDSFSGPRSLSDGRFAFVLNCGREGTPRTSRPNVYIMVWSPDDEKSHRLFSYAIPWGVLAFTLSPDASRGVGAYDTSILDKVFWLDKEGAREVDLGLARARRPSWSPDGRSIVVLGNRRLTGEPGPQSVLIPNDMYLMPADCEGSAAGCAGSLEVLIEGVPNPTLVAWSPDGQWLAFGARLEGQDDALYLRRMADGELIRVLTSGPWFPEWAPDGKRLVVEGWPPGYKPNDEPGSYFRGALYLLDVSNIVGK